MVNLILAQEDLPSFAADLAAQLQPGDALLLRGPLGAGKTALSRALLKALTGDANLDVQSPTFPLCLTYECPKGTVWHYDLYRLPDGSDVSELGWDEARRDGIAIVEWPDKARSDQLHKPHIDITIAFADNETRHVTLEEHR